MRILIILGCFYLAVQNILLLAENGLDLTKPDQIALLAVTVLLAAAGALNAWLLIKKHSKVNETGNETTDESVPKEED